jgi:ATP-dependent RNA helicase DeaD
MISTTFSDLLSNASILRALEDMGFTSPSPIQEQTIPLLISGSDVIGQAQTGTGKTAAFGIPMVDCIDLKELEIQSVVLCPTRELAMQVAEELKKIATHVRGLHILPVYGGEGIQHQLKMLKKGVHIVVGTPGRVMDHMERGSLSFDQVKMIVLDEADEMLNMGFREDIEHILSTMPTERQTILFSATMPKPIMDIASKFQRNPQLVKVTTEKLASANIEQFFYDIRGTERIDLIVRTMQAHQFQLGIVFCNTKLRVDEVAEELTKEGINAEGIHGDLNQNQRNKVLGRFKEGLTKILVATDVAARGIDVNNVEVVFNYDIPMDPEYYVHRIGRTGRAGKSGKSYSFVCGSNDFRRLKKIELYAKSRIEKINPPSAADIFQMRKQDLLAQMHARVAGDTLAPYYEMVDEFFQSGLSNRQLSAAILSMLLPPPPKEEKHTKPKERPIYKEAISKGKKPYFEAASKSKKPHRGRANNERPGQRPRNGKKFAR